MPHGIKQEATKLLGKDCEAPVGPSFLRIWGPWLLESVCQSTVGILPACGEWKMSDQACSSQRRSCQQTTGSEGRTAPTHFLENGQNGPRTRPCCFPPMAGQPRLPREPVLRLVSGFCPSEHGGGRGCLLADEAPTFTLPPGVRVLREEQLRPVEDIHQHR